MWSWWINIILYSCFFALGHILAVRVTQTDIGAVAKFDRGTIYHPDSTNTTKLTNQKCVIAVVPL